MLAPGGCAAWQAALKSLPASPAGPVLLERPSAIACCDLEPARGSLDTPEGQNVKQPQQESLKQKIQLMGYFDYLIWPMQTEDSIECRLWLTLTDITKQKWIN